MNLNILSGLLLAVVVLAVVAYLLKEVLEDRRSGRKTGADKGHKRLAGALDKLSGGAAKPVNDHLIGETGEVVEHSDDSARPMTVDLRPELWPARAESTGETQLPIGTPVKVTGVDGPVLIVTRSAEPEAASTA